MTEKISFEELDTAEKLAAVRRVADSIWPETFAPILSPEQIVYMMKMMYAPEVMEAELAAGVRFELLRIGGEEAGYLSFSAYAGHPGAAKLHKVYLLSKYHSRGLGQAMLNHAAARCRALGFTELYLNVNKHNERAIRAYERNGFRTAESVKNPIGNGFFMDDYVMMKEL